MDNTLKFIFDQFNPDTVTRAFLLTIGLRAIHKLEESGIPTNHPLFKALNDAAITGAEATLHTLTHLRNLKEGDDPQEFFLQVARFYIADNGIDVSEEALDGE